VADRCITAKVRLRCRGPVAHVGTSRRWTQEIECSQTPDACGVADVHVAAELVGVHGREGAADETMSAQQAIDQSEGHQEAAGEDLRCLFLKWAVVPTDVDALVEVTLVSQ